MGPCAFPASFAQARLWFVEQLEPGTATYNLPFGVRLRGSLDVPLLEKAVGLLACRHETLRTSFALQGGELVQWIHPTTSVAWRVVDLADVPLEGREERLHELVCEETRAPFDLSRAPLSRTVLFRLGSEDHVLLAVLHHIISDGWSVQIFLRELASLYSTERQGLAPALPALPVQYADYSVWQREQLQGEFLGQLLGFWQRQLADAPLLLPLPTDHPCPQESECEGGRERVTLAPALRQAVTDLCRREGVTPFMAFLAVFSSLLSRLSGEDDLLVGTPMVSRNSVELEGVIGLFLNLLPLRCNLAGNPTFLELLRRVRDLTLDTYANQDLPFERLVEDRHPERTTQHTPIFQVLLNLVPPDTRAGLDWAGLDVERFETVEVGSKFDLTLYVNTSEASLELELVYRTDLFARRRMSGFLEQFVFLLQQATESPGLGVGAFSLLTPTARAVLPDPTAVLAGGWECPLAAGLSRQAARFRDRTAVEDAWGTWTYGDLEQRSNQLAHELLAHGIGRGDFVAIHAVRSGAMVCGLLAVLKAGAAFVLLDAAYPLAVLARRLGRTRPRGLLHLSAAGVLPPELTAELAPGWVRCCLVLPPTSGMSDWPTATRPVSAPDVTIEPDQPAYVVFTSGSTGEPKAVVTAHRPGAHFLAWQQRTFALSAEDRFSQLSGLSHDPLLRDVLAPLWVGATLCIPSPDEPDLGDWFIRQRITVAHLTPAVARLLFDSAGGRASLRLAFLGGDVLRPRDVARLRQWAPSAECVNFYGTTETPQAMGCFVVPKAWTETAGGDSVPVGRGIEGVQLLVLNAAGHLTGVGEPGEIHVRTPYLSLGYLGDDENTRARFIVNPLTRQPEDRLYRTGDMGRYRPDGQVEFVGRTDHQVKIRGHRVELAAVEAELLRHPALRQAAAIVRRDPAGELELLAFVVSSAPDLDADVLRAFVSRRLAPSELPSRFVILPALPLNRHGKIDGQALLALIPTTDIPVSAPESLPHDELERRLAGIWAAVLQRESVGVDRDFFMLGGHSLLALRLIPQVNEAFGTQLSLRSIFEARTVSDMCRLIRAQSSPGSAASPPVRGFRGAPSGVPFFMVPGFFGLGYLPLSIATELENVCPYHDAIHYSGVYDDQPPNDTMEGIAAYLLGQIVRLVPDPRAPVCVGGFSFGGTVAFEIARLLRQQGRPVPLVLLYDSRLRGHLRIRSRPAAAIELLRRVLQQPRGQRAAYLGGMVRAKLKKVLHPPKAALPSRASVVTPPGPPAATQDVKDVPDASVLPGDVSPAVGRAGLLKESVRLASLAAMERYQPEPYAGRVVLFKATEQGSNEWIRFELDRFNGWGPVVTAGLETVLIPRYHLGVFVEPIHPLVVERTVELLRSVQKTH